MPTDDGRRRRTVLIRSGMLQPLRSAPVLGFGTRLGRKLELRAFRRSTAWNSGGRAGTIDGSIGSRTLSRASTRCSRPLPARRFRTFDQATTGGAGGARTHDRRIMRTTARRSRGSTCTDTTEPCHRWPSLHCMHGWLGPRTGPRLPQRAPDASYGALLRTVRDPPFGTYIASTPLRTWFVHIWMFGVALSTVGLQARGECDLLFGSSGKSRIAPASQLGKSVGE